MPTKPKKIFLIAGEPSGDSLGGRLIGALRDQASSAIEFAGVGGDTMAAAGLASIFPLGDVAVMGPAAIARRLPTLVKRVYQTVEAAIAFDPDIVVIIDSPEFTHPIAKRIRRRNPNIPIIDYVSPSVWAWRPGRARKMRPYVDHVLGLLPFEPEAHRRLGGPPCTYIGHALVEELDRIDNQLHPGALADRLDLETTVPKLVVLPGSRMSEVERLLPTFGQTIDGLLERGHRFEILLPTVSSVREKVEAAAARWPITPHILEGRDDMFMAFRLARAALAASGTVTLELAATGVPMVVAYRVDPATAFIARRLIFAHSAVLPNLVLGDNTFPEFIQQDCTSEKLTLALSGILGDGAVRSAQLAGLARVRAHLLSAGTSPSQTAAEIVLKFADRRSAN